MNEVAEHRMLNRDIGHVGKVDVRDGKKKPESGQVGGGDALI